MLIETLLILLATVTPNNQYNTKPELLEKNSQQIVVAQENEPASLLRGGWDRN
jgi:hypothetical protein